MRISALDKLEKAHNIIIQNLGNRIITDELVANHNQRKYSFRNGTVLYIVFNNAGEYAYQLLFSMQTFFELAKILRIY